MQSSQLKSRLGKVESALQRRPRGEESEEHRTIQRAIRNAMLTMNYRDREEFSEMLELWIQVNIHNTLPINTPMPPSHHILDEILETTLYKKHRPMYFGPEVFDLYKQGEMSAWECGECGCLYPANVLVICQLCGGTVGNRALDEREPKVITEQVYRQVEIRLLNR